MEAGDSSHRLEGSSLAGGVGEDGTWKRLLPSVSVMRSQGFGSCDTLETPPERQVSPDCAPHIADAVECVVVSCGGDNFKIEKAGGAKRLDDSYSVCTSHFEPSLGLTARLEAAVRATNRSEKQEVPSLSLGAIGRPEPTLPDANSDEALEASSLSSGAFSRPRAASPDAGRDATLELSPQSFDAIKQSEDSLRNPSGDVVVEKSFSSTPGSTKRPENALQDTRSNEKLQASSPSSFATFKPGQGFAASSIEDTLSYSSKKLLRCTANTLDILRAKYGTDVSTPTHALERKICDAPDAGAYQGDLVSGSFPSRTASALSMLEARYRERPSSSEFSNDVTAPSVLASSTDLTTASPQSKEEAMASCAPFLKYTAKTRAVLEGCYRDRAANPFGPEYASDAASPAFAPRSAASSSPSHGAGFQDRALRASSDCVVRNMATALSTLEARYHELPQPHDCEVLPDAQRRQESACSLARSSPRPHDCEVSLSVQNEGQELHPTDLHGAEATAFGAPLEADTAAVMSTLAQYRSLSSGRLSSESADEVPAPSTSSTACPFPLIKPSIEPIAWRIPPRSGGFTDEDSSPDVCLGDLAPAEDPMAFSFNPAARADERAWQTAPPLAGQLLPRSTILVKPQTDDALGVICRRPRAKMASRSSGSRA